MSGDLAGEGDDLKRLSYEEALKRLEAIVGEMEGDDLDLEGLTAHYGQGMRLRKVCLDKLTEAEKKVQKLEESMEAKPSSVLEGGSVPGS